jgi:NAD(P)-dependent dehydrogenase (short-subunit alcohol dehydrogenase family)
MNRKTVLITGTSSGFGRLAVPLLLERGFRVLAGIRGGDERLREIFAAEIARYGDQLTAVELHLEAEDTFAAAESAIESLAGGKLDVLVNNAGFGLFGALEDQTPAQLRNQMEVNFFGPTLLTRRLLPSLLRARGRIINVSSVAGRMTLPLYGPYCASKFALEAMTEALHYELRPFGVQVSLIEPGGYRTGFTRNKSVGERSLETASPHYARAVALDRFQVGTTNRQGDPIRVARKIAQLSEQKRIPIRVLMGADAVLAGILLKILPESWRVWLVDFAFRKIVFRD